MFKLKPDLPLWQSHQLLQAVKIDRIELEYSTEQDGDLGVLVPSNPLYGPIHVSVSYMQQHPTRPGGYYTRDSEGREGWQSPVLFELNHRPMSDEDGMLDYSEALRLMKFGMKLQRVEWNGVGMWLEIQHPDDKSKMTLPYIYLNYPEGSKAYPDGARGPWLASQTDMLANDWQVID